MSEATEFIKYPHPEKNIHPTIGQFTKLEMYNGTLKNGSESAKGRAEVVVQNDNEKERSAGTFFIKKYNIKDRTPEQARAMALDHQRIFESLRSCGVPVPRTCRFVEDKKVGIALVMSDLTEGGNKQVWSINNTNMSDPENRKILIDMGLTENDFSSLTDQIKSIGDKLERNLDNSFAIAQTGFFVVGNRQEGFNILIGDVGDGFIEKEKKGSEALITNMFGNAFIDLLRESSDQVLIEGKDRSVPAM